MSRLLCFFLLLVLGRSAGADVISGFVITSSGGDGSFQPNTGSVTHFGGSGTFESSDRQTGYYGEQIEYLTGVYETSAAHWIENGIRDDTFVTITNPTYNPAIEQYVPALRNLSPTATLIVRSDAYFYHFGYDSVAAVTHGFFKGELAPGDAVRLGMVAEVNGMRSVPPDNLNTAIIFNDTNSQLAISPAMFRISDTFDISRAYSQHTIQTLVSIELMKGPSAGTSHISLDPGVRSAGFVAVPEPCAGVLVGILAAGLLQIRNRTESKRIV